MEKRKNGVVLCLQGIMKELSKPGSDILVRLTEPQGSRWTTTKLKGNRTEFSSRFGGRIAPLLHPLLSDKKFQAPIFARQLTCTVAQRKFVKTQTDPHEIKGHPCDEFQPLTG